MANYNIKITNPKGEHHLNFAENVSMDVAKKWLHEYGPAPIGWHYQLVNQNKRPRKYPDHILVTGYYVDKETGEETKIDERKARIRMNNGSWYSPKRAKKQMRAMGAMTFRREKVFT